MKSVFYMPDGMRRNAIEKNISIEESYYAGSQTLKIGAEFFLNETDADTFYFYGTNVHTHERTDSSMLSMFNGAVQLFEDLLETNYFEKTGFCFDVITHNSRIPEYFQKYIDHLKCISKNGKNGKIVLLYSYSLDNDITNALKNCADSFSTPYTNLTDDILLNQFREHLLFKDIDLVLRNLEMRLSVAPVYAMGQSQMIIIPKSCPETSRDDFYNAYKQYLELIEYRKTTNPIHEHLN